MARQRLLAERKLPTTDNKDEMLFQKRRKKMPLIVNEYSVQEALDERFQERADSLVTLPAAWDKAFG
ncbi:hypothetical protein [Pseudomonas cichorii]|nr:hypothetical protein [Pseudomonas cichorii]